MSEEKVYAFPNQTAPTRPAVFDSDICTGCNMCVDACQCDVYMPNPEKGEPPLILYPDECWYCACCVDNCPNPGAIKLNYPLLWRVPWKRKDTGEYYWIGMENPPPPNTKPLV